MSYRITTYSALLANLATASTTLSLCRSNIGRLAMLDEEREETITRLTKQITEIEGMILELTRPTTRIRYSPKIINRRTTSSQKNLPGGD